MKTMNKTSNLGRMACALIMFSFWFLVVGAPAFAAAVSVDALWSGLFDNSGQPLAAGKVYTYAAGGTTPKAIYTDSAKSTAAANPIILDAYGRAAVYADGSYKFVITDADDVTLATLDNLEYVSTINPTSQSVTNLSATNATIASATISRLTATNVLLSSASAYLMTLTSPEIANASMTGSIYNSTITGGTIAPATFTFPATGITATPTADTDPVNKAYVDNCATPTASTQPANKGYVDARVLDAVLPNTNNIYVAGASMTLQVTAFAISSSTYITIPNSTVTFNNTAGTGDYVVSAQIDFSVLAYGGEEYTIVVSDDLGNIYSGVVVEHGESTVYRKMPVSLGFGATIASGSSRAFSLGMYSTLTDAAQWIYHYNRGGTLATAWRYVTWSGN